MISDRIESYLRNITMQTKNCKIRWRPIEEFFASEKTTNDIWVSFLNEFTEVVFSDSFYAYKNGEYIFVIKSKWISGADGTESIHSEVLISCSEQSEIVALPYYEGMSIGDLIDSIKEYWERKCSDYNQEISDIFDVLSTFAGE